MRTNAMDLFKEMAEECLQNGDSVVMSMEDAHGHIVVTAIPSEFEVGEEIWITADGCYSRITGEFTVVHDEIEEEFNVITPNGSFTFSFI